MEPVQKGSRHEQVDEQPNANMNAKRFAIDRAHSRWGGVDLSHWRDATDAFNDLQLHALIGRGGFAKVWRASSVSGASGSEDFFVAVKVFERAAYRHPEQVRLLAQELMLAQEL
eukprot:6571429-Prymnesium_polylepis.1